MDSERAGLTVSLGLCCPLAPSLQGQPRRVQLLPLHSTGHLGAQRLGNLNSDVGGTVPRRAEICPLAVHMLLS